MADLSITSLTVKVGARHIADNVSLDVAAGSMVALVGMNGAGKSTVVRAAAGYIAHAGQVRVDNQDVSAMPHAARARTLAWLPQTLPPSFPIRVRDAVLLGRYPFGAALLRHDRAGDAALAEVSAACGITPLLTRNVATLSGGELARVHLARTLIGGAKVLLIDEPVAALDPAQRLAILAMLRHRADAGAAILIVLHDMALAGRYCDRIVAMRAGRIVAEGPPAQIITPHNLAAIFDVEAVVDSRLGWPQSTMIGPLPTPVDAPEN